MAVPAGYMRFKDAGRLLAKDWEHGEDWVHAVWEMFHALSCRAVAPNGSLLDLEMDELKDPAQATFRHGYFSLSDNTKIDVIDGLVIEGQFRGCMIVVRSCDVEKYISGTAKIGRPSHREMIERKYRKNFPQGHTGTWQEAADTCGTTVSTLKRALDRKK